MPGVLGVWTGADLNAAGYGPLKTLIPVPNRDGTPMKTPTRHSLATDKVRFVGDPVAFVVAETLAEAKDAAETVMLDIDALPAVTDAREAAAARRAGRVRRRARQYLRRLLLRRHGEGGRGLRQGSPRDAPAAGQQPHRRLRHGAALGDRRVRRQERPLHAARRQPGRVRPEAPDGRSPEDQAGPDARADRQCRRLVRHEGLALSRVRRAVPRFQDPGPAGEMDRRTLGQLLERPAWPRSRFRRRAGARQGRQVSSRATHRLRQCRRLSRQCRPADGLDGRHAQPRRDLSHAA